MTAARAPFRAVLGVALMFATNGAIFAGLLPWYPTIASTLELTPAAFGVIVACHALGGVASSAAPAPLIARFGTIRVSIGTTMVLALVVALAAWSTVGFVLAIFLFFAGFMDAIADVSQNLAGVRVQTRYGKSIISSMHAMWSLGAVAGGAVGTAVAAAGIDIRLHLAISGIVCTIVVCFGAWLTRGWVAVVPRTEPIGVAKGKGALRVLAKVAPLAILAACCTVVEDVANNWSGIAGVRIAGLDVSVAGVVFTVVVASQCVGRFTGDLMIDRRGRVAIARFGGVLVTIGGVLVVASIWPWMLFVGFALIGFGSATLIPSAFAAAAEVRGVSDGAGVTLVGWIMRIGFLVASPIVGVVTDLSSIRIALVLLVVAGVAAVMLSGALRPPERRASSN